MRITSEDDLFLSVVAPKNYRAKKQQIREIAKTAAKEVKPDFSNVPDNTYFPTEVGRGSSRTKFRYTSPDFRRDKELMTEDDIFDSVINPSHKVKVTNSQESPEVTEYYQNAIQRSLLKRGRSYKKI